MPPKKSSMKKPTTAQQIEEQSRSGSGGGGSSHAASSSYRTGTKPHYLEAETMNEIPLWLAPAHLVAALFHYMQSAILFAFSRQTESSWDFYTNFPSKNEFNSNEHGPPVSVYVGSASLTTYAGIFVLLSAIDHTLMIMPGIRTSHEYWLQRSISTYRWYEYCLSAALMQIVSAQIGGITDIHLLFCIFFLKMANILFGAVHEQMNARARADGYPQQYTALFSAVFMFLMSWCPGWCYLLVGRVNSDDELSSPSFVPPIMISMFCIECCFGIVFFLQWFQIGVFKDYMFGEFCFIMLSFTAKTFLAWISYGTAASTKLL